MQLRNNLCIQPEYLNTDFQMKMDLFHKVGNLVLWLGLYQDLLDHLMMSTPCRILCDIIHRQ